MIVSICIALLGMICFGLAVMWSRSMGWSRAMAAASCRFLWVLPLVLSLTPETVTEVIPNTLTQQPVHILLDDSASMRGGRSHGKLSGEVQDVMAALERLCLTYGCLPKISRLSEMHPRTKQGWTPLSAVMEPWLFKIGAEPWLVLSDGADWRPAQAWDDRLRERGLPIRGAHQGMLLGFGRPEEPAYWLDGAQIPGFAFEGRNTQVDVTVKRAQPGPSVRVQVQVSLDEQPVISVNAQFPEGGREADATLSFASPARGHHLLTIKALPVSGEKDIWDNEIHGSIDVMANTIGVLHLLGAPSWDGRFLRRYFKAEPKFDLISFFILRDPWDSQQVSEREMSLIPFPVERLFKDELSNFRVLVIQNFTMLQFLQSEYQENLVKFVKDGGGLLFIGGPRSLTEADLQNSPLSELLPFTLQGARGPGLPMLGYERASESQMLGGTYDAQEAFRIELAQPEAQKRALANVYDDWEQMGRRLTDLKSMRGLHRMSMFKFKSEEITPLLNARTKNGATVPLAVASYPGKGRALWLFSDSLWRVGMSADADHSRFDYQEFFDAAMTWLMRSDRRPPLTLQDFSVELAGEGQSTLWRARLLGPAARYVGTRGGTWNVTVCGHGVPVDQLTTEQQGGDAWTIAGEVPVAGHGGAVCVVTIEGDHPAFGSVKTSSSAVFSETLEDRIMSPSPRKLAELARITGAKYVDGETGGGGDRIKALDEWLLAWTGYDRGMLPNRFKTIQDFYWVLNRSWIWLLLLLLPAEVFIRRWHLLVGRGDPTTEDIVESKMESMTEGEVKS